MYENLEPELEAMLCRRRRLRRHFIQSISQSVSFLLTPTFSQTWQIYFHGLLRDIH